MATIKFSSVVSDARGRIGGTVFSRGQNGSYIRTFSMPKKSNSVISLIKRQYLAHYSAKWRELTKADRKAWIQAAIYNPYINRVGETSYYSGFQLYMKVNLDLEAAAIST